MRLAGLNQPVSVNYRLEFDNLNRTPLHYLACSVQFSTDNFQALYNQYAKVTDVCGFSAVMMAAYLGNANYCKLSAEKGIENGLKCRHPDFKNYTSLMISVMRKNNNCAQEMGYQTPDSGVCALFLAVLNLNYEYVQVLFRSEEKYVITKNYKGLTKGMNVEIIARATNDYRMIELVARLLMDKNVDDISKIERVTVQPDNESELNFTPV